VRILPWLAVAAAVLCLPFAALADDWTNLRYAVYNNQEAEVVKLLDGGVDVNLADAEGWTALHVAAEQGNQRMVSYLLARGANPDLKTKTGRTAYDVAQGYAGVQAVLKAKMTPAADPFAAYLGTGDKTPAPQTPPAPPAPAARPAAKAAAKPAAKSTAKPAAADHCKVMWREARALCDIEDTSCNMSASIRYQSCQKKGTWY
jgi:hypothetical protein